MSKISGSDSISKNIKLKLKHYSSIIHIQSRTSFQSGLSISKVQNAKADSGLHFEEHQNSQVQNTGSACSRLHFKGLEHQWYEHRTKILKLIGFSLPFQSSETTFQSGPEYFEVQKKSGLYSKSRSWWYSSKIQEAVSFPIKRHYLNEISKIQDYSILKPDSNYLKAQSTLVASDVHRFPEVKFRRSSASERILYEILKVHSFPSAF
ncbi:hypothetical protein RCL_jg10275.t1 [Rhizophagus clarus]|uniref:Uncharacterized protein n=1 Tax=Rhizophagus clarus TaxID=94130 RepID=A0A8H3KVG8_9GLOM|nr:hypothetical protein RCL_jg10275.t1 [Rhizophagus clarus]